VDSVEYATPLSETGSRLQIEQEVFMDLLAAHNSYKNRAGELAQGLIDLKDLNLNGGSEEELYAHIEGLLEV
jgi:DNA repair protein SbcD/Mre11